MKTELKDKIRKVVREMVSNKVHGMYDDMTMDDTFGKELLDEPEFADLTDDEVDEINEDLHKGRDGYIEDFHFENLIDGITMSFMNRFKDE